MIDKTRMRRAIWLGAACGAALIAAMANEARAQNSNLPSISVEEPNRQTTNKKPAPDASTTTRSRTSARSQRQRAATAAPPSPSAGSSSRTENPRGPINGYVATRTMAGTKTNTPLNEIPQSISVVGAEQIRDQKPATFDQILRYAPGVGAATFGADTRNDWFYLRGFRAQQDAFFLNGLSLFNTGFATWKLQPFGLERVEILSGPSSPLYGGGNPGGIVNAVSKMPSAQPIRYLETGVDNYGNGYLNFDFGGPVPLTPGTGWLDYRILGTVKGGNTQVDYTRDDSYFIAPSVTYRPDLDTTITILAQASKDKTNGNNWLPYQGSVTNAPFGRISTSLFTSEPGQDYFKRTQAMIGYQLEHNINDNLTFRQNMRYGHVDVDINSYIGYGWSANDPSTATLNRYRFYANNSADLATVDNQLEGRFNTGAIRHTVIGGLDYKNYSLDDVQATGFYPGFLPVTLNVLNPVYGQAVHLGTPYNNRVIDQQQVGLYVQDQMKLDRWTLVLSGRNDWVNTDITNRDSTPNSSSDNSKATWRAGLIYAWDYGLSPYVSYATNFNPVIGTYYAAPGAPRQMFLPEEAKQIEAGVKWEPVGFNGNINFAWFDLRKTNALTVDPNPLHFGAQVQNGEVTSRGIEVSAVSNLTREFKMIGSFSTYDLFISKDVNTSLLGKAPVAIPSMLGSLWGDYTIRGGALDGLGFGAGVRYVGKSYADQANTMPVPERTLGDVSIHYDWQQWRAQVNITNITDEIYVAACDGATSCFYGDRRRVLGSLAYKW